MTTSRELWTAGASQALSSELGTDPSVGLVATGTTKADALQLVGEANQFVTVAANTGAILPVASGSPLVTIYNGGVAPLSVYAHGKDTINALSASASFSVTNGKVGIFHPAGALWNAALSA